MIQPKIFIGPMSKNVVDSVIEYCNENNVNIGLIPSRRQIEVGTLGGGYVNNWTTKEFCEYVRSKTDKILLVRDHGGDNQGNIEDNGSESLTEDCKYFDVIHIDPWKKYQDLGWGILRTEDLINYCFKLNPNLYFEIATEEAIRPFTTEDLNNMLDYLKRRLEPEVFERIKYLVIQSGTALKGSENIGTYNQDRLIEMVKVAKKWNLIAKEHNGDYLSNELIKAKFEAGLDCINIAPEFGQIETKEWMGVLHEYPQIVDKFYKICLESKKWVKWVSEDFKPEENKEELIKICGHYVFSTPEFKQILNFYSNNTLSIYYNVIKIRIKTRIKELLDNAK